MANLTAFRPFRNLSTLNPFRSNFNVFGPDWDNMFPANLLENIHADSQLIPVDISEDDKTFRVRAEMPGFKKENIHISIDGALVSINANSKEKHEEKKDDKVVVRECYFGHQSRSFTLPQTVDNAAAKAEYTDGVLEIVLPKKDAPSASTIKVA